MRKAHLADVQQVQLPLLLAEGFLAECRIDADDKPVWRELTCVARA